MLHAVSVGVGWCAGKDGCNGTIRNRMVENPGKARKRPRSRDLNLADVAVTISAPRRLPTCHSRGGSNVNPIRYCSPVLGAIQCKSKYFVPSRDCSPKKGFKSCRFTPILIPSDFYPNTGAQSGRGDQHTTHTSAGEFPTLARRP